MSVPHKAPASTTHPFFN